MKKFETKCSFAFSSYVLIFLCSCILFIFHSQLKANTTEELTLTNGNYIIPYAGWDNPHTLNTLNDVIVTMNQSGGASIFNMYDNSKLTTHFGSSIIELNLYDNTTALLYVDIDYLFIDPSSTALVKLYAEELWHDSSQYNLIQVRWLESGWESGINLVGGYSTYSHIQFIPEPATLALLATGFFAIRKRRKR